MRSHWERALFGVLTVAMIGLGSACGAGSADEVSTAATGAQEIPSDKYGQDGDPDDPSTLSTHQVEQVDWAPAPNVQSFVAASDAAVVGRVTAIGPARWNTRDNRDPGESGLRFRDATLEVSSVVYASQKLPASPGQRLTVRLYGDDTETGPTVSGAGPVRRYNKISGPVAVGDEVLWVLAVVKFGMNDGTPDDVVKLVTDYFGSWHVDRAAGQARSLAPERTAPFEALVHRLQAERAKPPAASNTGRRGRVNPLE